MRVVPLLVAAAVLSAGAGRGDSYRGVLPRPAFGTPGSAAYCSFMPADQENAAPRILCWRPSDGRGVSLRRLARRGSTRTYTRPPRIVHGIGVLQGYAPRARRLAFGARFRYRCADSADVATCRRDGRGALAFTCVSRTAGLTCTNAARHGFWIGRARAYRLF